jgi:hypothetical protein
MVGEGPPSTFFLAAISKDVDGGPSPTMTGEAKRESQRFFPLALDWSWRAPGFSTKCRTSELRHCFYGIGARTL